MNRSPGQKSWQIENVEPCGSDVFCNSADLSVGTELVVIRFLVLTDRQNFHICYPCFGRRKIAGNGVAIPEIPSHRADEYNIFSPVVLACTFRGTYALVCDIHNGSERYLATASISKFSGFFLRRVRCVCSHIPSISTLGTSLCPLDTST